MRWAWCLATKKPERFLPRFQFYDPNEQDLVWVCCLCARVCWCSHGVWIIWFVTWDESKKPLSIFTSSALKLSMTWLGFFLEVMCRETAFCSFCVKIDEQRECVILLANYWKVYHYITVEIFSYCLFTLITTTTTTSPVQKQNRSKNSDDDYGGGGDASGGK